MAVFERLSENFEGGTFEFRQFVQKKYAMMGEGNFTRPRNGTATQQTLTRVGSPGANQSGLAGGSGGPGR